MLQGGKENSSGLQVLYGLGWRPSIDLYNKAEVSASSTRDCPAMLIDSLSLQRLQDPHAPTEKCLSKLECFGPQLQKHFWNTRLLSSWDDLSMDCVPPTDSVESSLRLTI